jgi:hypothetical protein
MKFANVVARSSACEPWQCGRDRLLMPHTRIETINRAFEREDRHERSDRSFQAGNR